ncbi:hypothetical protein EVJ27_11590 [Exiguobacterium sp. SH3S2]|uniref:hypothetical protein n=1 Tax=unclassified Exiguobacterium TaxID=2644629 RepID=UPI00103FACC9|nr:MULTISPECIES: hypothetical protein [unclassified Exiguobacterium]TCI42880.1 hypothetical protein EVJ28_11610 [Exiguobacterium sp. SH3S3]TCI58633.1 hypothetical protein EVJ27_11590 [Exiguobacterium sp. SH3S2]
MTQRERFDHLYEAGKRSTRQAFLLGLFIVLLGLMFWFTGERRLAELIWFVLFIPAIGFVKIWSRTKTLLTFNDAPDYRRLVWYEYWSGMAVIVIFCILIVTLFLYPEQVSILVLTVAFNLFAWIASSKIDQKLANVDSEHVTQKVYDRGKVGFFPK